LARVSPTLTASGPQAARTGSRSSCDTDDLMLTLSREKDMRLAVQPRPTQHHHCGSAPTPERRSGTCALCRVHVCILFYSPKPCTGKFVKLVLKSNLGYALHCSVLLSIDQSELRNVHRMHIKPVQNRVLSSKQCSPVFVLLLYGTECDG
jgi:hypothetical protein